MSNVVNSSLKLSLMGAVLILLMTGCSGTGAMVLEDERGGVTIES